MARPGRHSSPMSFANLAFMLEPSALGLAPAGHLPGQVIILQGRHVMDIALPLNQMTTAEKLRAMEALWADLSRDETNVPSPPWHEKILQERDARLKSGEEAPIDWETAKQQLRQASE